MSPTSSPRRVGVRDVARLAGVSTQTVSRVLNDHAGIRAETRARVEEAMSALDYRVNNAARALGTATTRTLGVIASDAALFGPGAGIVALEAATRAAGRWMATAYADAASEASVVAAAQRLLAQGVDGLVVLAPHAPTLEALADTVPGVPVAALHAGGGSAEQEAGAALAIDHLVACGHRRIGRLAGPDDWIEAVARDRGMAAALAAAGCEPGPRWVGDWSAESGDRVSAAAADAVRAGMSAVAVANDQMALGLISGLRARGIDVPGEVSVTGFDDNPDAAFYRPALTTVRLDLAGEARRAVATVLGEPYGSPPAAPALVRRASTREVH